MRRERGPPAETRKRDYTSILKVAHIGAGSFVFGPGVMAGTILEHRMGDVELALMDVDRETVELMAAVGRRVARDEGLTTRLTAHTDRATALTCRFFAKPPRHIRVLPCN